MAKATLNDVKLFLDDLLLNEKKPGDPPEKLLRREQLGRLSSGAVYLRRFQKKREEIDALPAALVRDTPLATELTQQDRLHDGYGRFLYHLGEAYRHLPAEFLAPAQAQGALAAQEAFSPSLGELQGAYADEAARARDRRPKLALLAGAMSQIPLAGGKDLSQVVGAMLDTGEGIGALLSERATELTASEQKEGRERAGRLLSDVLGLIGDCRRQIAVELADVPALPRDLDALIFGYFDYLAAQRQGPPPAPGAPPPAAD
jgi:hypothetical protein